MAESIKKLVCSFGKMQSNPYHYIALEPDEIRTVMIQPGGRKDHLLCTIEQHKLTELPEYEAISYAWGTPKRNRLLRVDERQLWITPNAESILHHLRSPSQPRRVWIDGICINQENGIERSQQVSLMHSVYSRASMVLIWMGKSDAHTSGVFQFFSLVDQLRSSELVKDKTKEESLQNEKLGLASNPDIGNKCFKDHESDNFSRISAFADRPWFHRAWTFQEACLSVNSQIMCGQDQLPLHIFISAVLYLTSHGMSTIFGQTTDTITALANFAAANPTNRTSYLSLLLPLTRNLQTTDPRDKVFALLGMIDRTALPVPTPSYAVSVSEVYTLTTRAMITQEGALSVLSGVYGPHHPSRNLPSWAPDWQLPRRTAYLHGYDWFSSSNLYCINKGAPFSNSIQNDLGSDVQILPLRGAPVATISRLCNPNALLAQVARLPIDNGSSTSSKAVAAWLYDLEQIVDTIRYSLCRFNFNYAQTGEDATEALMKTLSADRGGVGTEGMGVWRTEDLMSGSMMTITSRWWSGCLHGENGETDDAFTPSKRLASAILTFLKGRTVFTTNEGLFGIAGEEIRVGDEIWDVVGGEVPFVLRQAGDAQKTGGMEGNKRLTIIGEAYVHGIMKGELWDVEVKNDGGETTSSSSSSPSLDGQQRIHGRDLTFQDIELS